MRIVSFEDTLSLSKGSIFSNQVIIADDYYQYVLWEDTDIQWLNETLGFDITDPENTDSITDIVIETRDRKNLFIKGFLHAS